MKKVPGKVPDEGDALLLWAIGFEYIGYAQVVVATHAIATCPLILINTQVEPNFSLY